MLDELGDRVYGMSGRDFVGKFIKQTFVLASRNVTISPTGARLNHITIKQFSESTVSFKVSVVRRLESELIRKRIEPERTKPENFLFKFYFPNEPERNNLKSRKPERTRTKIFI